MTVTARSFVAIGASLGLAGVILAAAASHGEAARLLSVASAMCLAHAPALLALAVLAERLALSAWAGGLMAGGTVLFATDLVFSHMTGTALLPMAAPVGGAAMVGGWAFLIVGAVLTQTR